MPRRLPPFLPLLAFDAVVRNRSFTRAAAELGVTQSAVSHQMRRLEAYFGAALIERRPDGLELTPDGAAVMPQLRASLDGLGALDGLVRRKSRLTTLRVGVSATLSAWWLVRRMPRFLARHPDIAVEFIGPELSDAATRPLDLRILWVPAAEARRSTTQAPLFREEVFPVCAPRLLKSGEPLTSEKGLLDLPLIHKGVDQVGEWSWEVWLKRLGLAPMQRQGGDVRFSDMGLCLTAAVDGAGVALGRSLLTHDALADRRLIRPLPRVHAMASSKVHIARWQPHLIGDRAVALFVGWLADEAERTVSEAHEHVRQADHLSTGSG